MPANNMNVKWPPRWSRGERDRVATVVAQRRRLRSALSGARAAAGVAGEIFMWKIGGARRGRRQPLSGGHGGGAQKAIVPSPLGRGRAQAPRCRRSGIRTSRSRQRARWSTRIGHHGEPGTRFEPLKTAREVARRHVRGRAGGSRAHRGRRGGGARRLAFGATPVNGSTCFTIGSGTVSRRGASRCIAPGRQLLYLAGDDRRGR